MNTADTVNDYDSKPETQEHIRNVNKFMREIVHLISERGPWHDSSKLQDPELATFNEYTPKLKDCTYGSDEYKGYLKDMQSALDHHYANNRHHPEHFENGIKDMNLIDIVEMFCDWKAATMRHNDGNLRKSIKINKERFGFGDTLESIFNNTVDLLDR